MSLYAFGIARKLEITVPKKIVLFGGVRLQPCLKYNNNKKIFANILHLPIGLWAYAWLWNKISEGSGDKVHCSTQDGAFKNISKVRHKDDIILLGILAGDTNIFEMLQK